MHLNMKLISAIIAAGMFLGFSNSAQANCQDSYNSKYGQGAAHKAFAMTIAGSALANPKSPIAFSCAWSVNQPTRQVAIKLALAQCESLRIRNDRRGHCRIVKSQ